MCVYVHLYLNEDGCTEPTRLCYVVRIPLGLGDALPGSLRFYHGGNLVDLPNVLEAPRGLYSKIYKHICFISRNL